MIDNLLNKAKLGSIKGCDLGSVCLTIESSEPRLSSVVRWAPSLASLPVFTVFALESANSTCLDSYRCIIVLSYDFPMVCFLSIFEYVVERVCFSRVANFDSTYPWESDALEFCTVAWMWWQFPRILTQVMVGVGAFFWFCNAASCACHCKSRSLLKSPT